VSLNKVVGGDTRGRQPVGVERERARIGRSVARRGARARPATPWCRGPRRAGRQHAHHEALAAVQPNKALQLTRRGSL